MQKHRQEGTWHVQELAREYCEKNKRSKGENCQNGEYRVCGNGEQGNPYITVYNVGFFLEEMRSHWNKHCGRGKQIFQVEENGKKLKVADVESRVFLMK